MPPTNSYLSSFVHSDSCCNSLIFFLEDLDDRLSHCYILSFRIASSSAAYNSSFISIKKCS